MKWLRALLNLLWPWWRDRGTSASPWRDQIEHWPDSPWATPTSRHPANDNCERKPGGEQ